MEVAQIRAELARYGQDRVLTFFDQLTPERQRGLLNQINEIDLALADRLVHKWVLAKPDPEHFSTIEPVPVIPPPDRNAARAAEAFAAGEQALRDGRVGLLLVAGGQGTRLGYDGPKGAFPIGPITGKSIFEHHAAKIQSVQRQYNCTLPWYIMVGESNEEASVAFFEEHKYFGLTKSDVYFFKQDMMPCVDEQGKFLLDEPDRLATNPNGHGGVIPALVDNGIVADAHKRGIDTLSYVQVDNWAVKVADPHFIGYHVLGNGQMSSKIVPKIEPRESVGVHCVCDGVYQVIEYTELDLYPQLLETDKDGNLIHYAANTAIHILSVPFVESVYARFEEFPWHCSHKKIDYIDEKGNKIEPTAPNGYKFETFVFDALRYTTTDPIVLEIDRLGEYTPIKQISGPNSVEAARRDMNEWWGGWLEAAGAKVPRTSEGHVAIDIEIDPRYARTRDEFVGKNGNRNWPLDKSFAIEPDGSVITK